MLRHVSTYAGALLLGGLLVLLRYHSASAEPEPATVEGVVTYHGEPVSDAFITFKCRGMSESLYGQTDDNGHYKLYSRMDQTLPIGKYAVTIVKRINHHGHWADHNAPWNNPEERPHDSCRRRRGRHGFRSEQVVDLLPEHYGDGPTSGLIAVIEPGSNVFDFALNDEVPKVSQEVVAHDRTARFSLN